MRNELSCELKVFFFMLLSFRVNMVRDLVKTVVLCITTKSKPEKCQSSTLGDPINLNPKKQKINVPQCVEFLDHATCRFFSSPTVRNLRCFFLL